MPKISNILFILTFILSFLINSGVAEAEKALSEESKEFVAVISMDMLILPGTQDFLVSSIARAESEGAKALIVELDTPGGLLPTTQEMIQAIFASKVPVIVYVSPKGATATSAGVFITLAAHIAAMAPGTSIGAAHPVAGDGKDIEGDMRDKATNMTVAMVKSITNERGRNTEWAEKSVKESSSVTETEALKLEVIDFLANDLSEVLRQIKGKKIKIKDETVELKDLSELPIVRYEMSFKDEVINVIANPAVSAVLWLVATTGLSIELYNPGLIFPGVVGAICLILALISMSVIPVSQGGFILLLVGAALIGLELFIASGILGVGGVIAILIGSLYMFDASMAPGVPLMREFVLIIGGGFLSFFLVLMFGIRRAYKKQVISGREGLVGVAGTATQSFSDKGTVKVRGELWRAELKEGAVAKGDAIVVLEVKDGLVLSIEKTK